MWDIYARERESAAFGGGDDPVLSSPNVAGAADDAGMQSAQTTPQGDFSVKNWVIAALILFLFMYTVSRVLD